MSIENILFQLLNNNECVVIPNFGGFIVRDSPCSYTNNSRSIKPQTKTLFFNPQLTDNDGLLISSISKTQSISYNQATELCNQWVNEQEIKLETEKYLKWSQFGTFYLSNDNKKWFQPLTDLNLDLTTFGLKTVKVNKYEPIEHTQEVINSWVPDRAEIESLDKPKSIWKAWLAAASIALVAHVVYLNVGTTKNNQASIISTVVPSDLKMENNSEQNQTKTEEANPQNDIVENPIENESATIVQEELNQKTNEISNDVVNTKPIQIENNTTTVPSSDVIIETNNNKIIYKYKLELNAIYHSKDLNKTGLKTYVEFSNGYYQVIENKQ